MSWWKFKYYLGQTSKPHPLPRPKDEYSYEINLENGWIRLKHYNQLREKLARTERALYVATAFIKYLGEETYSIAKNVTAKEKLIELERILSGDAKAEARIEVIERD